MCGAVTCIGRRKSIYLCLAAAAIICLCTVIFFSLFREEVSRIAAVPLSRINSSGTPPMLTLAQDHHPIQNLMNEANAQWFIYEASRPTDFPQTIARYRERYGRHPPPGFKRWYMFARQNGVHNVDDFQQIIGDLRPFWAIPPHRIRQLAAQLQDNENIAGIRLRNHQIVSKPEGWRADTFIHSVERIAKYLPDMDIAMNKMDQPRVMVTHEEIQKYLKVEENTRGTPKNVRDQFTPDMAFHYSGDRPLREESETAWISLAGKPYMDYARDSCPPDSPARNETMTIEDADQLYKSNLGGFITNFTRSSDLCYVGPVLGDKHGFLFSSSSNDITRDLVPIFSECKVSVNNDILFPANMYFLKDERYVYDNKLDHEWENKTNTMLWRGVTSGGVQLVENWNRLHRQRFVKVTNTTEMINTTVQILSWDSKNQWQSYPEFYPSEFASSYFDIGFTEAWGCIPDCLFYEGVWTYKDQKPFSEQFGSKYLVDLDGHSFSGRWRAFQQSKSLGIKTTIFREWHDSRLFPWRHFVPMDGRFTDLYALMTYFIGLNPFTSGDPSRKNNPYVPSHDLEAKLIATQSQEWAQLVLRDEDLEIYLYLLLLEYGRIIDDNRDSIGYGGDGSELAQFDAEHPFPIFASTPN